jgi:hypothetical protein
MKNEKQSSLKAIVLTPQQIDTLNQETKNQRFKDYYGKSTFSHTLRCFLDLGIVAAHVSEKKGPASEGF